MQGLRIGVLYFFIALFVIILIYLQHPLFGKRPSGKRLERIKNSPHYKHFQFKNLSKTPLVTYSKISPRRNSALNLIKKAQEGVRPPRIPYIRTDIKKIDKSKNCIIRLGHSAYFIQLDGKTFLIDPTLISGSPVPFANRAFPGTNEYKPADLPFIDYLLITHDHYDHLDYFTVKKLKNKIGKVICGLGVGSHFEYRGFSLKKIVELDWDENFKDDNTTITSLPARHFSGRLFRPNNTLRTSFMIECPSKTLYIAGDGGYDTFYKEIGKKRNIDIAIVENGQYSKNWRYIHTLPQQLPQTIKDLGAKKIIPAHNGKYALSTHLWKEPLEIISKEAEKNKFKLLTPKIGEVIDLNNDKQTFEKWREKVE